VRVKATAKAFYGDRQVYPGDVIVVPDDFSASWAKPVELPKAKPAPAKKKVKAKPPPAKKKAKRKAAKKKAK
jgi:hypothetical protein